MLARAERTDLPLRRWKLKANESCASLSRASALMGFMTGSSSSRGRPSGDVAEDGGEVVAEEEEDDDEEGLEINAEADCCALRSNEKSATSLFRFVEVHNSRFRISSFASRRAYESFRDAASTPLLTWICLTSKTALLTGIASFRRVRSTLASNGTDCCDDGHVELEASRA